MKTPLKSKFNRTAHLPHLMRRGFSVLLCLLMTVSVFPVTAFSADDEYPLPQKIIAIDASDSSADNSLWYVGTYDVGGVTTVIPRYEDYVAGAADEVAELLSVLGGESHPYIIETGLEMAQMASIVNGGTSDFNGKYIRLVGSKKTGSTLTNNVIDLIGACGILYESGAGTVSWLPCDYNNNSFGWTPIGTSENKFNGTVYADENVRVYNLAANLSSTGNHLVYGLFGYLGSNAVLNNIKLSDVQIYSSANVSGRTIGTLAGDIGTGSAITDCEAIGITPGRREELADGTAVASSLNNGTDYSNNWYTVPDFTVMTTGSQASCVGGLVARTSLGTDKATGITDCLLNTKIIVERGINVGGVIGSVENMSKGTFTISGVSGSAYIGTSAASGSYMYHVGGVMGYCNVSTAANRDYVNLIINNIGTALNVFDVSLFGKAYVDNGNTASYGGFGGILGYCNSVNSLTIGAASGGTAAPCHVKLTAELTKCSASWSNNNFYVGGVIGRIKPEANADTFALNIESCNVSDSVFRRSEGTTDTVRISMGGIVGGLNNTVPNSVINNCVVDNFDFSTDGFCGGIIGIGYSASGCNVARITNCTVQDCSISQASESSDKGSFTIIGGIAASIDTNTDTVSNCKVQNSSLNFLITSNEKSHNQIGGIAGKIVGTSESDLTTISNCIVQAGFIIGASDKAGEGVNPTGIFIGGVAGYASNVVVNECITAINFSTYTTYTNNIERVPVVLTLSNTAENSVCGGIFGYANGNVTITNSYTTGCIDTKYPTTMGRGNRSNVVGGLVGVIGGSAFSASNSFSTASLVADLKDAVGGLFGYNNCINAQVSSCHFGGSLMNASSASIVNYSVGGVFTNITYNQKMSPSVPCATNDVTATNSGTIPTAIANATSEIDADYYTIATTVSVTFTGNNVFAVNDSFTGVGKIVNNTATVGDVTVTRPVKLIRNIIDSNQDGCNTPFLIENSTDLSNMQQYVANGGGYLGARFSVNADISSNIAVPIGMANTTVEYADEDNQPFCGVLDGGGHTLTLTAASRTTQNYNGLFGYIQNASVSNLNILYPQSTAFESDNYAGGLVGYAAYSVINSVTVKAINGLSLGGTVSGGIVGYSKSTVVNGEANSYSSFTGKLTGSGYIGGIVGKTSDTKPTFRLTDGGSTSFAPLATAITITYMGMQESSVSRSFVIGDVIGGALSVGVNSANNSVCAGGIIGESLVDNNQVNSCFVKGNVSGGKYVGGLIGSCAGVGAVPLIVDSYIHGDVYGNDFCGGAVGFVKTESVVIPLVSSVYFVGQVDCPGAMGALTSSVSVNAGFIYDTQVAGNIPVCANTQDAIESEATSEQLIANSITAGSVQNNPEYEVVVPVSRLNPTAIVANGTVLGGELDGHETYVTLYSSGVSWNFSAGNADPITQAGNFDRLAVNNTNSNNSVVITFTGTYFHLYDHITGGHDGYNLSIDGVAVPAVSSYDADDVQYTSTLYRVNDVFTGNSEEATISYLHNSAKNCLIYVRGVTNGTPAVNSVENSFSVTGLSYGPHTITITGCKIESNSYMNIRGYVFGSGGSLSVSNRLSENFTITTSNYPQLTEVMTNYATFSDLSTDRVYDFTSDATSNAHNLSSGDSVTVNVPAYTCNKTNSELEELGVTVDANEYSVTSSGNSGTFIFTENTVINGYSLNINEKVIVVPFSLGEGTADSPYLLRNVKELTEFRDYVNGTYNAAGQHFLLAMDSTTPAHSADGNTYDLSGTDQSAGDDVTAVSVWSTPIGTESSPFQGVFDGNSKTVSNLNITSLVAQSDEGTCYNGLFGYISSGEVKNLTVEYSAEFVLNSSASELTNRGTYFGAIAANVNSTEIANCRASGTVDVTEASINAANKVFIGGAVGCAKNNSVVKGVLCEADVLIDSTANVSSAYHAVGGVIGGLSFTDATVNAIVAENISYSNIISDYTDTAKTARLSLGGIIGYCYSSGLNGTVNVRDNSVYGTYRNYRGNVGGIIGNAVVGSTYSLRLTDNVSSASLNLGGQSASDTVFNLGGLIGTVSTSADKLVLNSNSFFGELNAVDNSSTGMPFSVGGLVGKTNALVTTNSLNNYYDSTKNRGITNAGGTTRFDLFEANLDVNGTKTSAAFTAATGNFPTVSLSDETDFGSTDNSAIAQTIVNGNSAPIYLVRNDNAYLEGESADNISLSSVFTPSGSNDTLTVTNYDALSSEYMLTQGGKRVVSINTDYTYAITVRVVSLDGGGNDVYGGKGKTVTFYPCLSSVGLTDMSYLSANANGDRLYNNTVANTYTVYTADSFMGLDCVVSSEAIDGFGNPCGTVLPSAYTVYLGANIETAGLDYLPADALSTVPVIGSADNPFTGVLDGTEHTVSGLSVYSGEANAGLFAVLDGAQIKNIGITDSSFSLTGSGNIGSFAGTATDTVFSKCFSSARVEQGNAQPANVNVGGFAGTVSLCEFNSSFFTGSVGVTASSNAAYPSISGNGDYYSAGFAAKITDTTSFTECYVSSYIHGDITPDVASALKVHNIGLFAAKGGADVTLTDCSADFSSSAEGAYPLGDRTSVTVASVSVSGGLYPSVWYEENRSTREIASRVTVINSTSASSLSRAQTTLGVFSASNYGSISTVTGSTGAEYYSIASDGKSINRTNSGIASVVLNYTGADSSTSGRMLEFNLQCWYDNYTESQGVKTFTLKSASDLLEFAEIVHDGHDSNVGHNHSSTVQNSTVASSRFEGSVVKLGNNIVVNDEVLSVIGDTPQTSFAGTFDGNGYSIINAGFECTGGVSGLFGYITDEARVMNVSFNGTTNIVIPEGTATPVYAGLVIAQLTNGAVENCSNYSAVNIINNSTATVTFGAISGKISVGKTLSNCYNMGHITALSDSMRIAGIAGENGGTVTNCYNTGIIDGYSELADTQYVQKTVVAGIAALNTGTVTQCYNAGILRYYADDSLYPIAPGAVSACYADGQYLTTSLLFNENAVYSTGITLLSTSRMSNGAQFDDNWTGWTYRSGFYPQFTSVISYSGNGADKFRAASLSSTYAGVLAHSEGLTPAFDNFTSVSFTPQDPAMTVSFAQSNLGKFSNSVSGSSVIYEVTKRGAATAYLGCVSGDDSYSREVYYINEEEFTVKYMFDFSDLTADSSESTLRTSNEYAPAGVNTFADVATRNDYGTGTAGNPYIINTPADLAAFSQSINQSTGGGLARYYMLASDIDCTSLTAWEPIGTLARPFEGTFNGNGHSVYNLNSSNLDYNGLFGYAGESSTIEIVAVTDSVFTAKTGNGVVSYTGAVAACSAGVITNCYSRAIISIPQSTQGTIYAGGIVGSLTETGVVRGCYVRPDEQNGATVDAGHNTIVSYTSSPDLVCGILIGKTEGTVDGCYHTAVYYEPVGYTVTDYGIIAGEFAGGTIQNTYYDSSVLSVQNKPLFVRFGESNTPLPASAGNDYAKTTAELKSSESSATENGVANDSMALVLSEGIYLGTYEMAALSYWDSANAQNTPYSNDGYPMLTSFDVLQYDFTHFESSNIIMCMQNVDASNEKLMNALCTYDSFSFPVYAAIIAKTRLNISVFSLPDNISYNVSAVCYGYEDDDSSQIKWTVLNGIYTNTRGLHLNHTDGEGIVTTGSGSAMVDNTASLGSSFVNLGTADCIPDNCDKMYVYITLSGNPVTVNKWGVYQSWDSSTLQELPPEEEEAE